jgi:hypothetical protein
MASNVEIDFGSDPGSAWLLLGLAFFSAPYAVLLAKARLSLLTKCVGVIALGTITAYLVIKLAGSSYFRSMACSESEVRLTYGEFNKPVKIPLKDISTIRVIGPYRRYSERIQIICDKGEFLSVRRPLLVHQNRENLAAIRQLWRNSRTNLQATASSSK